MGIDPDWAAGPGMGLLPEQVSFPYPLKIYLFMPNRMSEEGVLDSPEI